MSRDTEPARAVSFLSDSLGADERERRALVLLKTLRRIKSVGIATESLMFLGGFSSQWRQAWQAVDELLAEETPGTKK